MEMEFTRKMIRRVGSTMRSNYTILVFAFHSHIAFSELRAYRAYILLEINDLNNSNLELESVYFFQSCRYLSYIDSSLG